MIYYNPVKGVSLSVIQSRQAYIPVHFSFDTFPDKYANVVDSFKVG